MAMPIATRPRAVVLGLMSRLPFAGIVFITMQYLVGLKRLGFDVYYVEEHGKGSWMLVDGQQQRGAAAAAFIAGVMHRFGLDDDHFAYCTPHDRTECFGLQEPALTAVLRDAA